LNRVMRDYPKLSQLKSLKIRIPTIQTPKTNDLQSEHQIQTIDFYINKSISY
jgi:hypothetical protein